MSWGVGRRRSLDPALLWLWCRPAAATLIQPLAWEISHAAGAAVKRNKAKEKTQTSQQNARYVCPGSLDVISPSGRPPAPITMKPPEERELVGFTRCWDPSSGWRLATGQVSTYVCTTVTQMDKPETGC